MLGQHGSGWIPLLLMALIGSTLAQARPALGIMRPPSSRMPAGIDVAIEQPTTAASETADQPASNARRGQRMG